MNWVNYLGGLTLYQMGIEIKFGVAPRQGWGGTWYLVGSGLKPRSPITSLKS